MDERQRWGLGLDHGDRVGLRWARQASEEQNSRSMFIEKVSQVP